MTSRSGRRWLRAQPPAHHDPSHPNIEAVVKLERDSHLRKSRFDRVIDAVRAWAGSPLFIVIHVVWIAAWILINTQWRAFDPYPFSLLNLTVAVEAIVLSSFLLMAQDRMIKEADRRDHLNLQIDLLAEQELTAILNVVVALAERAGIDVKNDLPEIEHLSAKTDVHNIAATLEREMGPSKRVDSSVESDPKG